jgi:aminoglycoside 2''-phosphotransferase
MKNETNFNQKYLDIIQNIFKEKINDYKILSGEGVEGTYGNVVFKVNQEWIFRFSKNEIDKKQLEIEKSFLKKFHKLSPLPVPEIIYEGEGFMGCRAFEGEPFTKEICDTLSIEEQKNIWKSIGEFLQSLHSMDFQHKNLSEYPLGDNDFWKDLWKPIEAQLSKKTRAKALAYFEEYFIQEAKNPIKKTICHADFHPNHIFFKQSTKGISGIIDFGRICINDPAVDFNLIERFFANEALEQVLQFYKHDPSENLRERITFQNRRRIFAAFYHAKAVGQTTSFPRYLARIEEAFSI